MESQKQMSTQLHTYNIDKLLDNNQGANTQAGVKLVRKYTFEFAEVLQELLEIGGRNLKNLRMYTDTFPRKRDTYESRCKELALITCTHMVGCAMQLSDEETSTVIGTSRKNALTMLSAMFMPNKLFTDMWEQQSREVKEARKKKQRITTLSKEDINRKCYGSAARRSDEEFKKAVRQTSTQMAGQLLDLFVEHMDLVVEVSRRVKLVNPGARCREDRTFKNIEPNPDKIDEIREFLKDTYSSARQVHLPSISKPREWETSRRFGVPLVRNVKYYYADENPEDTEFKMDKQLHSKESMPRVYAALNSVESTEWTIDCNMVDVLKECVLKGIAVPGLNTHVALPNKPPSPYEFMDKNDNEVSGYAALMFEEKVGAYRKYLEKYDNLWSDVKDNELPNKWARLQRDRVSNDSKTCAAQRSLQTADNLREYAKIWFTHNLDSRGRVYPVATSLNPQMNDTSKGLLKFAAGKAVNDRAAYWLRINLANLISEKVEVVKTDEELLEEIQEICS
jgi:DNA-directed RNA polymerase